VVLVPAVVAMNLTLEGTFLNLLRSICPVEFRPIEASLLCRAVALRLPLTIVTIR